MNIEIISGSPREKSITNRIAVFLKNYLQDTTEHHVDIIDARNYELPHLQEVWTSVEKAPTAFKPLAQRVFEADAFILVSPEFNGSYAPALKNLLDHFPKQHRKPFAIVTGSPGAFGGIRATQQMQLLVAALFGILAPNMLVTPMADKKFDEGGNLTDPGFQKAIDNFLAEFLWLAESLVPKLQPVYN
jgi:NAD(P)H-dependent FMN reductase